MAKNKKTAKKAATKVKAKPAKKEQTYKDIILQETRKKIAIKHPNAILRARALKAFDDKHK